MVLLGVAATLLTFAQGDLASYKAKIAEWRVTEEVALKREDGWLAVAGLFWLKGERTTFGAAADRGIRLPSGPGHAGAFLLKNGQVAIVPGPGAKILVEGSELPPGESRLMTLDAHRAIMGDLTLMVIKRGDRIGVRLWDKNSKNRREFKGMRWYPVDPNLRIEAKFVPFTPPKPITIMNVLGDARKAESPGYAEFTLNGELCRLTAEPAGDQLFFNFQDNTNSKETYGAGRFLSAPKPANGNVILDFNQATNPPCAFTDFATCPLPPKGNQLPVAIKAGEKKPLGH